MEINRNQKLSYDSKELKKEQNMLRYISFWNPILDISGFFRNVLGLLLRDLDIIGILYFYKNENAI